LNIVSGRASRATPRGRGKGTKNFVTIFMTAMTKSRDARRFRSSLPNLCPYSARSGRELGAILIAAVSGLTQGS
jgi:hypothetical protein